MIKQWGSALCPCFPVLPSLRLSVMEVGTTSCRCDFVDIATVLYEKQTTSSRCDAPTTIVAKSPIEPIRALVNDVIGSLSFSRLRRFCTSACFAAHCAGRRYLWLRMNDKDLRMRHQPSCSPPNITVTSAELFVSPFRSILHDTGRSTTLIIGTSTKEPCTS